MNRVGDYEERSTLVAQLCNDEEALKSARSILIQELSAAAGKIVDIFKAEDSITDPVSERLKFDAAKHALKLGGLEVERHEHGGKVQFEPIKIFQEAE